MTPRVTVCGSGCPACVQARAVLDRFGLAHDDRPIAALPRRYGRASTMPQITVDGELLGGTDALIRLARSGGLERLARGADEPWVDVRRRLGRGYEVVVLDRLGRRQLSRRAASRADADRIAATLADTPGGLSA
jgi:glutaredoxin